MDLRFHNTPPTEAEREAIDAFLGEPLDGWTGGPREGRDAHTAAGGRDARDQRHLLLPVLHAVQERVGWISPGALNHICRRLTIPPADAWGVATFYALFPTTERPPRVVHVCDDIACRERGGEALCATLEKEVGPAGTVIPTANATWMRSPCLGLCDHAPAAFLSQAGTEPVERLSGPVAAGDVLSMVRHGPEASVPDRIPIPQAGDPTLRLLRRVGGADPADLDDYRAHGGYAALRRALSLGPVGVIREVTESKLAGRGGAAFPTGRKWDAVARQPARPHYVVCNADESEPGTFKDRVLMEGDPFAVIEAMTIAAFATGAEQGFIYVRGEYPVARERLRHALDTARERGFLGDGIQGTDFSFDIEIRKGAGAYICGEETAIFNSIEGYRGEPRNKPPFPVESGLFGCPTLINNVETLVNVLEVLRIGGPAYAAIGTPGSTGTRLFCLSGSVTRPGVYEVEHGTTLRSLVTRAGGVAGGRPLQAILLGGAAGSFVTPADLDLRLTFEDVRTAGVTLGSGVVMLFDDRADLPATLARIAAFFRDESCGQCVPCRVGTVRQQEVLARLAAGQPHGSVATELALLDDIALAMKDASICGLGQTAANAVESAITRLGLYRTERAS